MREDKKILKALDKMIVDINKIKFSLKNKPEVKIVKNKRPKAVKISETLNDWFPINVNNRSNHD